MRRLALAILSAVLVASACSPGSDDNRTFTAEFTRAVQVFPGNSVRVLGVTVGRVTDVQNTDDAVRATIRVEDPEISLPADVNATIIPVSLLGERYIQLFPAYEGGAKLEEGANIPRTRTSVPVEQDELLRSLQDYFGALDPEKVADFVTTTAEVLRDNGEDLNDLIHTGSSVIGTLSDKRDSLARLITEFESLTDTLLTRQATIERVIHSYNAVASTLNTNRDALEGTITGLNEASVQLASLLIDHRSPLDDDIDALTKTARTLSDNVETFARTGKWADKLFSAASKAVDFDREWLRLGNQGAPLVELLEHRLRDRLVGVCLRLEIEDCAVPGFWAAEFPDMFCFQDSCPGGPTNPKRAIKDVLNNLPDEVDRKLRKELRKKDCSEAKHPKRCRERKRKLLDPDAVIDELLEDLNDLTGTIDDDGEGLL